MPTKGIDTGLLSTVVGLAVALLGAIGKIIYDYQKSKTESEAQKATAHAQEIDAHSKTLAVEQTATGRWQDTLLASLDKSNDTASEWMQRYGDVLVQVGSLQAQVATLAGQVGSLQNEVKELKADKERNVGLLETARVDALELRAKIAFLESENNHLRIERDEYKRAHSASMTLFEGVASDRSDPAFMHSAGQVMKEVIKYERDSDGQKPEETG